VWDLAEELKPGDLLVVNNTRVLKARLAARRRTGGAVELLVLEPRGEGRWLCLARPAKRLHPGEELELELQGADGSALKATDGQALKAPVSPAVQATAGPAALGAEGGTARQLGAEPPLVVTVLEVDQASGGRVIQFPPHCVDAAAIEALLDRYGSMPLPPYIHQQDSSDDERYQTRYADKPGAVAAPTAGLHLSDELLEALKARGVRLVAITLHVGLGTFRPVETEDLSGLELHSEWVEVSAEVVDAVASTRAAGGRVIAMGTTSVRALEGAAAVSADGGLQPFQGPVALVIQPGFRFRVVEGLITNFHLPQSSLLLLVSALIGRPRLLELYATAINEGYRFFSYGDAMWIAPAAVLPGARP
jgi:S-adenosylmethionine:tRNA ribosyltransferase-isomerase